MFCAKKNTTYDKDIFLFGYRFMKVSIFSPGYTLQVLSVDLMASLYITTYFFPILVVVIDHCYWLYSHINVDI